MTTKLTTDTADRREPWFLCTRTSRTSHGSTLRATPGNTPSGLHFSDEGTEAHQDEIIIQGQEADLDALGDPMLVPATRIVGSPALGSHLLGTHQVNVYRIRWRITVITKYQVEYPTEGESGLSERGWGSTFLSRAAGSHPASPHLLRALRA